MNIPQTLRQLRQLSGMTQEQVAGRVGLTRQAISSYESGRTHPDVEMLVKLAEVYQTDLSGILYGSSAQQKKWQAIRTTAIVAAAAVLLLVLLRSGLLLWTNTCLPVPRGGPADQEAAALIQLRFSMLRIWELLGGLSQAAAFVGCLVLAIWLVQLHRPPAFRKAALWALAFTGALLACTLPFAAFDQLYSCADYLLVGLKILLPLALLLVFWAVLALLSRRTR